LVTKLCNIWHTISLETLAGTTQNLHYTCCRKLQLLQTIPLTTMSTDATLNRHIKTRSSATAGRPCDAKACQGLLKWTWKWQPSLKWPSNVVQGHQKWHQSKASVWFPPFLLVVYSNFCRITHRFWEIWCETVQWPWNMPKVIASRITWKLSCGHVCKMFGIQWTNEAKIAIFNYHTLIWTPADICINLILPETTFPGLHFCRWHIWVALQIFEQFCPKAGDANPSAKQILTQNGHPRSPILLSLKSH